MRPYGLKRTLKGATTLSPKGRNELRPYGIRSSNHSLKDAVTFGFSNVE